jgi:hypothetical protein
MAAKTPWHLVTRSPDGRSRTTGSRHAEPRAFVGNEIAAQERLRAGRRLDSPALVADGNHARVDGFVSLGVLASAAVVSLGLNPADPVIGREDPFPTGKFIDGDQSHTRHKPSSFEGKRADVPKSRMEPFWSPGVATGGNQRQIDATRKPLKQAKSANRVGRDR